VNFWSKLKKPIFILAPMDGVTDTVFRQIIVSLGKPDVLMTEFVPVEAILSKAQDIVIERSLKYTESERPIVAQIWGTDPDKFYQVAILLKKLKFDGIDINMGCPVPDIIKNGSCSALINNPDLAVQIINATIKGAGGLPVSIKTRIGFSKIQTETWVKTLLQTKITALTLHLRTAKEMSKVPAHWEEISKAVGIRNRLGSETLIIGNGDIKSLNEAKAMVKKYQIDGVMIGRAIFDNVYLFNPSVDMTKITPNERFSLLLKHLELYESIKGEGKHFEMMKKFVKCYIGNFDGATFYREKLMMAKTLSELMNQVRSYLA